MAKGPVPSPQRSLASLAAHYRRMRRSLLTVRGENAELARLMERQRALRQELAALRAAVRERRRRPRTAAATASDPALLALRESILAMSRNLAVPVELD